LDHLFADLFDQEGNLQMEVFFHNSFGLTHPERSQHRGTIAARSRQISMNSYDSAFEQASNDRVEVRVAIEKLLTRGEMLDKLLESLAPFVSSPKAVGESDLSPAGHTHAEDHREAQAHHEG
jgi:hypothetical protein